MKKQQTQAQAHYCFKQEAGSNIVKLYIYDDVSEYGEFDWWTWEYKESETSAKYFKKALENVSESDTIELHINSYGGSVKEGVAIYNLLKQKKCKEIVAYVDGFAYSIASVILQAADRRIMGLGTSLLIHNMWLSIAGNADDLRKAADDLDVLMESNRQICVQILTTLHCEYWKNVVACLLFWDQFLFCHSRHKSKKTVCFPAFCFYFLILIISVLL